MIIDEIIKEIRKWRSPNNPDKSFSENQIQAIKRIIRNQFEKESKA